MVGAVTDRPTDELEEALVYDRPSLADVRIPVYRMVPDRIKGESWYKMGEVAGDLITDRPSVDEVDQVRLPGPDGCGTSTLKVHKTFQRPAPQQGTYEADVYGVIIGGRALCPLCWDIKRAQPGMVAVVSDIPSTPMFDSTRCGDFIVIPQWSQPATKLVGYGGPSKMARWLPGGSKYTGALYGDNIKAAGPVGRQKSPIRQLEEASQRGYDRVHGSSNVTSNEAPIEEPTAAAPTVALAESSRLPETAPEPAPAPQRAPERAQSVVMGGSGVPAPKARQEPRVRSGEPSSVTDGASIRPVGFAVAADCPKCGGVGRIQKECWHWRVKGTGPQFAMVPCPKCRAGSPAGPRPVRASTPVRQTAPTRALSDVMGVTTSVGQIAPQRAPSRAVADIEQWMASYLNLGGKQPQIIESESETIKRLKAEYRELQESDRIGQVARLERLVADLRESLRLNGQEADREAARYAEQQETIASMGADLNDRNMMILGLQARMVEMDTETERFRSEMVRAQQMVESMKIVHERMQGQIGAMAKEQRAYRESKVRVIRPNNAEVIEGEFVNA